MISPLFRRLALVALCLVVVSAGLAHSAEVSADDEPGGHWRGVQLANTIAQATGIAISPLLGVSAVGAWQYFHQPADQRGELPWFAQVWFWAPALIIVLLLVAKDPVLGFVPIIKKPLDALDVVENTASAIVGSAVVIPLVLAAFSFWDPGASASVVQVPALQQAGFVGSSTGLSGWVAYALVAAVFGLGFFVVWLASHAINVLILLSPFGPLDMLLRGVKGVLLIVVIGSSLINPYLGAFVSLLLLFLATRIAGWSFRLMVFGCVFAFDGLTLRHRSIGPIESPHWAFSTDALEDTPVRSYGQIEKGEHGALVFRYRPWLVFPTRTRPLPEGRYFLGRGVLCPSLLVSRESGDRTVQVLRFPPRYRNHDEPLAASLGVADVRDLGTLRGLRAAVGWLKEMLAGEEESVLQVGQAGGGGG